MKKIRIITDSASDIQWHRPDLTVLPLRVTFGDEDYLDGVNLSNRAFYEKLIESDTLPTTSLISPVSFEDAYAAAVADGEQVITITLSSKLSGTYQSAVTAASSYQGSVYVVDSLNATIGEQILVRYALELVDKGKEFAEIIEILEQVRSQIRVLGLLDTLEYLKKGGRISKTVAFVGGALSIKPVLTVQDGEIVLLGKARGSRNGSNLLIREIENANGVDFTRPFCLGYTGLDDTMLQKYITDSEALWVDHTDELPICAIGATIGTHVGPNAIAVAFFANAVES